jgi:hypothetical protein
MERETVSGFSDCFFVDDGWANKKIQLAGNLRKFPASSILESWA